MKTKYQEALDNLVHCKSETKCKECRHKDRCTMDRDYKILKELVDKATPKYPIITRCTNKCPRCKNTLPLKENALKKKAPKMYCDRCGQRIDWRKGK